MRKPEVITLSDTPGIINFLRQLDAAFGHKKEGTLRERLVRMQRVRILQIVINASEQGYALPITFNVGKLESLWADNGLLDDSEVRGCFDQACVEVAGLVRDFKPMPVSCGA